MSDPTPKPASAFRGDPTANELVSFVRGNWKLPVTGAVLFSLAVLVFGLLRPSVYQARATLAVSPARFASQLKPDALTILGYQRILESDEVIVNTAKRLVDSGVAQAQPELLIGENLESRIFTGRRAEEKTLARVLELTVRNHDPEFAAAIANAWATTFLEALDRLRAQQLSPALSVIEEQYEVERTGLEELTGAHFAAATRFEKEIREAKNMWDRRLLDTEIRWNQRLKDLAAEALDQVEAYQRETESELAAVVSAWAAEQPAAEPGPSRQGLEDKVFRILALRTRLALTPRVLSLESAGSEDSQWLAMVLESGEELQSATWLPEQRLVTEKLNPAHSELLLRLAEVETTVDDLNAGDRQRLLRLLSKLEQEQRRRSAGLEKQLAIQALDMHEARERKGLELRKVHRDRESEIALLELQREQRLAQLDREIGHQQSAFDTLGGPLSEAQLARAERSVEDVRIAARAVPIGEPLPRGLAPALVISAMLGAFAGLLVALLRGRPRG